MKLNFITPRTNYSGYGMASEALKKYLGREGIILEPNSFGNDVTFIYNLPPSIQNSKSKINVLFTMLEGDTVPLDWHPYLSQATHIIVPSTHVQQAFKNAGFETTLIPLGYDEEVFTYVEKPQNNPYVFLHYEAFQDRKGWQDLIEGWLLSGLEEEQFEAKLILKTIKSYKEVYETLQESRITLPYNVRVICGELPHHAIKDILSTADCFVFPSRGEGFSHSPLEAMACGIPTIISKGHAHLDYYNEDYMYGVDCNIKIPAWENQGNFVRCNIDNLADTLKYVYDNKEEARRKGQRASEYVKKYSYTNTARALKDFLWQIV